MKFTLSSESVKGKARFAVPSPPYLRVGGTVPASAVGAAYA